MRDERWRGGADMRERWEDERESERERGREPQ